MKALIISALVVFGLFAVVPATYADPVAPPECAGMSFTSTVVATGPVTWEPGTGVILVIGLPSAKNIIAVPNASAACIVGGDAGNSISGSPGDDVIISRGALSAVAGKGGNDTCYGTLVGSPHPVNIACETVLP